MLFVLVFLSILFFGIGFLLTKDNAEFLLSGYNTMNSSERKKFNLEAYIPFFRKFHQFLGLSLLLGGLLLYWLSPVAAGIFLAVYPIIAYLFLFWRGNKVSGYPLNRSGKVVFVILFFALAGIVVMLARNLRDNDLVADSTHIVFDGSYGESIEVSQIESIGLVEKLPDIVMKTNGFGLGPVRKGTFKTREGKKVKLLLNRKDQSYLLITRITGEKLYYSSRRKTTKELLEMLESIFPALTGNSATLHSWNE